MSEQAVFLITGASSGIGAQTARRAVAAGYRVALAARSSERLHTLVEELGGPETALAVPCDVTDSEAQAAMAARVEAAFGRIDVVFANAGRGGGPGGFSGADPAIWHDMIQTNVLGAGLTLRHTLAAVKAARGHVLLTGSAAGRTTIAGSMYGATKWAVTGMAYNLRDELRGTGVRVTVLEPGMVDTPFFEQLPHEAMQADDIAGAALYAVSQPESVDVNEILIRPTPPIQQT
jgi:NADP-dependent 3-hydroxy acid dehydrogenase YdfG